MYFTMIAICLLSLSHQTRPPYNSFTQFYCMSGDINSFQNNHRFHILLYHAVFTFKCKTMTRASFVEIIDKWAINSKQKLVCTKQKLRSEWASSVASEYLLCA